MTIHAAIESELLSNFDFVEPTRVLPEYPYRAKRRAVRPHVIRDIEGKRLEFGDQRRQNRIYCSSN